MPVISTNQTTTTNVSAFESLFVLPGVVLTTNTTSAIVAIGNNGAITLAGIAISEETTAIDVQGSGWSISVSSGGFVVSNGDLVPAISSGSGTYLSNDGVISSAMNSGGTSYSTVALSGSGNTILNTGRIFGGFDAIGVFDGGARVINSGVIEALSIGYWSIGITTATEFINTGTILAPDAIALSAQNDRVANRGLINGNVILSDGDNILDNLSGVINGTVSAGFGNDYYRLDVGISLLDAGGNDTIEAWTEFDLGYFPTIENLFLATPAHNGTGNALANAILGNESGNVLNGNGGNDSIFGNGGNDTIDAGIGDDQVAGGNNNDVLLGAAGNDNISGEAGDDSLNGGSGADTLNGGDGDDTLWGNASGDRLNGDDGEDVLIGGAGRDTLTGGADADTFVFRAAGDSGVGASLRDIISGFEANLDLIDLTRIDANAFTNGNQAFTFIGTGAFTLAAGQLRAVHVASSYLQADVNGDGVADFEIQLNGIAAINVNDILL